MDYFNEAFGGFNPLKDKDAALKFVLDSIFRDFRFAALKNMLSANPEIDAMEGEPGWFIERRDAWHVDGHENWPRFAIFRAFVDPRIYALTYPEFFFDRKTLDKYIESAVRVCGERYPDRRQELASIGK